MTYPESDAQSVQERKNWAAAKASVRGTSHIKDGKPCQDYSLLVPIDGGFIAAVSDGAGSAAHSEIGAELACHSFVQSFADKMNRLDWASEWTFLNVEKWQQQLVSDMLALATLKNWVVRDLACTFLGVILKGEKAFCVHIGDGAIVLGRSDNNDCIKYECAFWPENGEYANLTNFITQDEAINFIQWGEFEGISEVAMFSDGIQRLVLNSATKTPHERFFETMIWPLRGEIEGESVALSHSLEKFLSSDEINDRTDDDKSLLIMTSVRSQNGRVQPDITEKSQEDSEPASSEKERSDCQEPSIPTKPEVSKKLPEIFLTTNSSYVDSLEKFDIEFPRNELVTDDSLKLRIVNEAEDP